jgi:hypothetical protein
MCYFGKEEMLTIRDGNKFEDGFVCMDIFRDLLFQHFTYFSCVVLTCLAVNVNVAHVFLDVFQIIDLLF